MALQDSANRVRFVEQLLKIDGINPNFQPFLSLPEAAIVEWLLAVVSIDPICGTTPSMPSMPLMPLIPLMPLMPVIPPMPPMPLPIGATPLIHPRKNGHESIVRQLLARDDINIVGFDEEWIPLAAACMGGHTDIANLLLVKERR